ncbi:IS3 family transposase [Latilactobacillus curvatus]|uniref:IS3 family transposase n=3 Tax=Latilactobacillus curvatus TaxID=28038 RepID=A0AAJ5RJW8_LATCU|nr:IS3 family transposase [Latilactobacillus curvatus]WDC91534.1 IS3 family transposase [Latilactobacillus curvatus]
MTKYSKTLKIKVVQDYLTSSLGYELIARKYGIKSNSLVVSWVQRYKAFGPKGLDVLSPEKTFDGSFKMNVLKWMKTNKASYPKTALHFNISNVGTIWQWQHIWETEGADALYRSKGRQTIMSADKQSKKRQQTELERLREENELLQIENEYPKKIKSLSPGRRKQQVQVIQELRLKHKLVKILKIVGMAKSTYEYIISHEPNGSSDQSVKQTIQIIKKNHPAYGYRRVTGELHRMNILVNHKKVLVLMRELQLLSTAFNKRTRKYNSYRGNVGTVAKNLINRRFFTDRPYQKLVTDVTEVRWGTKTIDERAYFTCIYDLFSGEILSHQVSKHPTVEFTTTVLNRAVKKIPKNLKYRTTVHSDQGFQYQHQDWTHILKEHRIFQSMSRKATCLDNAAMESFFHIMKAEAFYQKETDTYETLVSQISVWIDDYNFSRIKTKLGCKSPIEYRIFTTQKAA